MLIPVGSIEMLLLAAVNAPPATRQVTSISALAYMVPYGYAIELGIPIVVDAPASTARTEVGAFDVRHATWRRPPPPAVASSPR